MGREIRFESDGTEVPGWLAVPASGRGPGAVVLHGSRGLGDPVRDACDRLAREGFVALAPDLYRGEHPADPEEAERRMRALDLPRATRDLRGAVDALLSQEAVDGARVGAVGFDAGGQIALYAASRDARIGAVVDFYGVHPEVPIDAEHLRAPVLGIFAEKDGLVPPPRAHALQRQLRDAGVRAEIVIFDECDHAFFNDARPDVYNPDAAAEAWRATVNFLRAELA